MSETALKFGPEWLRALSHGGSVSSPPPSPGLNKFKVSSTIFFSRFYIQEYVF